MHLSYLGDALDHWKGSLFDGLSQANLLTELAADAMPSDGRDWRESDWSLYARLLHLGESQIVRHSHGLADNRQLYFDEIKHHGDLFLDPDTGITTGRSSKQHLTPTELFRLLAESDRVVAVYQHVRAMETRHRVSQVVKAVQRQGSAACCSYESGTVSMLLFSRKAMRCQAIAAYFCSMLGRHAKGRISLWK